MVGRGNMAILGYDPAEYHTGRAPIEAAAMGVELGPDEVAYRCNLVTLSGDDVPVMVDFAAGHPTNAQSHAIVAELEASEGIGGKQQVPVQIDPLRSVPREPYALDHHRPVSSVTVRQGCQSAWPRRLRRSWSR